MSEEILIHLSLSISFSLTLIIKISTLLPAYLYTWRGAVNSEISSLTLFISLCYLFINFAGEGNKSLPLNANWTSPKHHVTNDKRKPLDDSYAGVSYKMSRI